MFLKNKSVGMGLFIFGGNTGSKVEIKKMDDPIINLSSL
jgi:hypothetical protein